MDRDFSIREIGPDEFERAWPIFREVLARGESYNYAADLNLDGARAMWTNPPYRMFLAEARGLRARGSCFTDRGDPSGKHRA